MSKTSVSPAVLNSEANILNYIIDSRISEIWTMMPVSVESVDEDKRRLSVLPLVQQIDNNGHGIKAIPIADVPYFILQGGGYGVDITPSVKDIGICLFAMRDISKVKSGKSESLPDTLRQYSPADAIYIGGFLNNPPQYFIKLKDEKITINAPNVLINGDLTVSGKVSASDVVFNGISAKEHIHIDGEGKRTSKPEL